MADIFISYAREDASAAQRLAAALESRGWSVFWDPRIPTGQRFDRYIAAQVGLARCIIVLWSSAAIASEWVVEEAAEGRDRNILAPALIEAIKAPPFGFRHRQAANLVGWRGEDAHEGFQRLIADIAGLLGSPARRADVDPRPGTVQGEVEAEQGKRQEADVEHRDVQKEATDEACGEPRGHDEEATKEAPARQVRRQPSPLWRMAHQRIWMLGILGLLVLAGLGWLVLPLARYRTATETAKMESVGTAGAVEDKKANGEESEAAPAAAPTRQEIKAQVGYLSIPDLSSGDVIDVFDQKSGKQMGNIQRETKLPVPPGTYKIKFGDMYWSDVQVPAGEKQLQVGFISIPDLSPGDVISVFDQRSGQRVGYIQRGTKLPVPPGTYDVKFGEVSQLIEVGERQEIELSN